MIPEMHPVQISRHERTPPRIPKEIALAAYEVYSGVFAPQEALITNGCRGGFGTGELIAFLYARSFPRKEWRQRTDEAFKKMVGIK